jgi:hypothetical protein
LIDESYVEYFLGRLNSLSNYYPPERVFNVDETCWRLFEAPRKVLAEKRSDTVQLQSRTGEKALFTAVGAISCAGQRLRLRVLEKGRTAQFERKFGNHPDVIMRHSETGWVTENVIIESSPCALVLDV